MKYVPDGETPLIRVRVRKKRNLIGDMEGYA